MPQFAFLEGQPFWIVYATLLVVILLRAPATYGIGRGLGAGMLRSRIGERLGPRLEQAKERIDRYGAPVVTLSFFTVGMQTAVNFSAGLVHMAFPRYFAAVFVGGLAWAGLWGSVISGLVGAWAALFLNSPWTAVGVVALAAVLVGALVVRARRRAARRQADDAEEAGSREALQGPAPARAAAAPEPPGSGPAAPGSAPQV
ncbi:DedA family protein [Nocardiopsis xinjiangensis]|uniref:DedA family protein n=1 Tax=Nocardiopsis xinjiangensis TaxID=124285 RepID=UPI0005275E65|nr:VTT domain-containing protein [Nocardiopsis xinjiangensis]